MRFCACEHVAHEGEDRDVWGYREHVPCTGIVAEVCDLVGWVCEPCAREHVAPYIFHGPWALDYYAQLHDCGI